jgi:hypothetical protein
MLREGHVQAGMQVIFQPSQSPILFPRQAREHPMDGKETFDYIVTTCCQVAKKEAGFFGGGIVSNLQSTLLGSDRQLATETLNGALAAKGLKIVDSQGNQVVLS